MEETQNSNSGRAGIRCAALFGMLEAIAPGSMEEIHRFIENGAEHTPPECGHGHPFCDAEGDPLDPPCGCKPTMAQIVTITHIAIPMPNTLVSDPEPATSTSKVANPKDSLHQPVVLGMGSKTILPEGH